MRLILPTFIAAGLLAAAPVVAHAATTPAHPAAPHHAAAHHAGKPMHAAKPRTDKESAAVDRLNDMALQQARGGAAPAAPKP